MIRIDDEYELFEHIETCGNCGTENTIVDWDIRKDGRYIVCEKCGERIDIMCSLCYEHIMATDGKLYSKYCEDNGNGCYYERVLKGETK